MGDSPVEGSPYIKKRYTQIFEEICPICMMWGMSYQEFWHDDPSLVRVYREKYDIERRKRNEDMWMQGLYFYNALQATMSQIFGKNGESKTYLNHPIPLTEKEREEARKLEEKEAMEQMKVTMLNIQAGVNAKKNKEVSNG